MLHAKPTAAQLPKGGRLPGTISSPEVEEEQQDRGSASDLEEPPVTDTVGKACKRHLSEREGALGQDHSLSPPRGPHPLCNCNREAEAGPDPARSLRQVWGLRPSSGRAGVTTSGAGACGPHRQSGACGQTPRTHRVANGCRAHILTESDIAEGESSHGSSHSKAQDHVELEAGHKGCGQTEECEEQQLHEDSGLAANPGGRRGQGQAGRCEGRKPGRPSPALPHALCEGGHVAPPKEPYLRETSDPVPGV